MRDRFRHVAGRALAGRARAAGAAAIALGLLAGGATRAAPPASASAPLPAPSASAPLLAPSAAPAASEPAEVRSTGREVAPRHARPTAAEVPDRACSFEQPVCVHAGPRVSPAATLWTLRHAEQAFRAYRALRLPLPLDDAPFGGDGAYDIYLLPGQADAVTTADLVAFGAGHDRASAFTVMPPTHTACASEEAVARSIAHAIALRLDAGAEGGALAMTSSYLATLASGCGVDELAAVDELQRFPERSFMLATPDRPTGALLFPWFFEHAYGHGAPGALITSLLAVAAQRTPPGSWEYANEPDVFDALRANMRQRGSSLDELLLDFAVARAFVGSRSDGMHLPDVARYGDLGRVRFEWSVPYGSLPRRLAPAAPIDTTGMTYLWIDLAGAPPHAELTFVADWELPALFRWALVKVDKDGAEAGRVEVAGIFGDSHAERTVAKVDGLAGVLVVGVNAGSIDRSHPFDPDEQPLMPHSYTVTLAK